MAELKARSQTLVNRELVDAFDELALEFSDGHLRHYDGEEWEYLFQQFFDIPQCQDRVLCSPLIVDLLATVYGELVGSGGDVGADFFIEAMINALGYRSHFKIDRDRNRPKFFSKQAFQNERAIKVRVSVRKCIPFIFDSSADD
ncbi:hypothetical protein NKH92_03985 [Mesorhizobium sp. M0871]|uniref:hypothetical protein n=1 Tax=unclassified Mesorhizobium TaxID=325217 RepID=UPI0004CEE1FE|nr:hypothetical protein [Mesorhizobium sp. LNJC384A00]